MTRRRLHAADAILAALCIMAPCAPAYSRVEAHFNSTERLEKYLKDAFSGAVSRARDGKDATIDIMIFSFTSPTLADSLLRIARDFPRVRIRILANLSQLFREPTSVMPDMEDISSGKAEGYLRVAERRKQFLKDPEERKAAAEAEQKQIMSEYRQRPIKNIEIRYKWFPSFSWDDKEQQCAYDHFHPKAALLHHKAAIINGEKLVTGSYNWSTYAETKNLENLMIITGEEDRSLVSDFIAEFEAIWNNPAMAKSGEECRGMKEQICEEVVKAQRGLSTPSTHPTAK